MQDIEHDMDDLFRKAADNYPLKSGVGNWETVSKKINEKNSKQESIAIKETGKRKKYLILLFIFFGLGGSWVILKNTSVEKLFYPEKKIALSNVSDNNVSFKKKEKEITSNTGIINQNKDQQKNIGSSYKVQPGFNNVAANTNVYLITKPLEILNERDENKQSNIFLNGSKQGNPLSKIYSADDEAIVNNDPNNTKDILSKKNPDETVTKKENVAIEHKARENKITSFKNKGAYVGLTAAVDFSNVKSMSHNKTGSEFGILLGYKFNQEISLETGLIANKKNYYTDGKYFNMDEIKSTMPSGMHIQSILGNSSIIEIPLKIKYDFAKTARSNAFISAGFSAYIMTAEKNNYTATLNGNDEQFYGVYNKDKYGFPAVANISLGYQHIFSKILNIRVEPFLKIPLRGMGVGDLPITSAGVQLSITHGLN